MEKYKIESKIKRRIFIHQTGKEINLKKGINYLCLDALTLQRLLSQCDDLKLVGKDSVE